jgi:hypothetical protein
MVRRCTAHVRTLRKFPVAVVKTVELSAVHEFNHGSVVQVVRGAGFGGELTLSAEAMAGTCAYGIRQSLRRISPKGKAVLARTERDVGYFVISSVPQPTSNVCGDISMLLAAEWAAAHALNFSATMAPSSLRRDTRPRI